MQDTFTTYAGEPWHADETDDCVRLFLGAFQIAKMPKQSQEHECYWPTPDQIVWILQVLNQADQVSPSP